MACNDNCEQNCESVANLHEYAANLIEYSKRIDRWVNGGQDEFVDVGGVSTPTLRNLAMAIKQLMGVHPDNQTIMINKDKIIYVNTPALIQLGGGLVSDENNQLAVDFSQMPTDKFEAMLKALKLPIWLTGNLDLYVDPASDGDSLIDGRGTPDMPFKHIQAAVDYACNTYNVDNFMLTIHLAAGVYDEAIRLLDFSRVGGFMRLLGDKDVVIAPSFKTTFSIYQNAGSWQLENLTAKLRIAEDPGVVSAIAAINADTGNARLSLVKTHVEIEQAHDSTADINGILCTNSALTTIYNNCSIKAKFTAGSKNDLVGICSYSSGIDLDWDAGDSTALQISGSYRVTALSHFNGRIFRNFNKLGTIKGTATGQRFHAYNLGIISTFGAGANYFPGSTAGVADANTFGIYS